MRSQIVSLFAPLVLVFITACGGDKSPLPQPTQLEVTSEHLEKQDEHDRGVAKDGSDEPEAALSEPIRCAGDLGDFDVALYPAGNNQFEVVVLPYEAYADQIAFSIAQSGGSSRTLSTLTFDNAASQEYSVGIITAAELSSGFDSLWLDGFFSNGQEAGALSCDLPMPTGGNNNY